MLWAGPICFVLSEQKEFRSAMPTDDVPFIAVRRQPTPVEAVELDPRAGPLWI